MPTGKPRHAEPDAHALIDALLEQLKNTNTWHEIFVARWVTVLRQNGVSNATIGKALGIDRTTVTRRFGSVQPSPDSDS